MGDALLPSIIVLLTVIAIASAVVLVRAAVAKPRIGALTERAGIAVVIALFGIVYSAVAVNTEMGHAMFASEAARLGVRATVIVLLGIPAWWTFLYLTGRLR